MDLGELAGKAASRGLKGIKKVGLTSILIAGTGFTDGYFELQGASLPKQLGYGTIIGASLINSFIPTKVKEEQRYLVENPITEWFVNEMYPEEAIKKNDGGKFVLAELFFSGGVNFAIYTLFYGIGYGIGKVIN